jgi:hypothetical protein
MAQSPWGQSYFFVVGAQDSDSFGSYDLHVSQLPNSTQVIGTELLIDGNVLGANAIETLDIDTDSFGGVGVTLNGQQAQFTQSQITAITVNSLGGNNTINVESLPQSVTLTLKLSNRNAVNFCPNANTNAYRLFGRRLELIQGPVSLLGAPTSLDVSLYDQDGSGNRTVDLEVNDLALPGGDSVSIKAPVSSITVWASTFAQATSEVNVGPTSMQLPTLSGPLTVHGGDATTLNLNDQNNDASGLTPIRYTISSGEVKSEFSGLTKSGFAWLPIASIEYDGVATLNLRMNNKDVEADVVSSPGNLNLWGSSKTTVNVCPSTHNLDGMG